MLFSGYRTSRMQLQAEEIISPILCYYNNKINKTNKIN